MSQIIEALTEIVRCTTQYRVDSLCPYGLKGCHASYLTEICKNPGMSQDQLAQRIFVNKSNVARQSAFLEENGFILRKPSPTDKRVTELYPTDKTLELLPKITTVLDCCEEYLTADMSHEEVEATERVLNRMKEKAARLLGEE